MDELMADEPIVAPDKPQADPPPAEEPKSLREHLGEVYDERISKAGAEEPAAAVPAAEGAPKANPDGSQAPAEEAPKPEPEKIEVTPEQLADSKYWGSLDRVGWERMERDFPVATKYAKAGQAAASRMVNEARRQAPPPKERTEAQPDDEPSAELLAAVELTQSLDSKEAAKGHLLIAKLTTPTVLRENGIDTARSKADAIYAEAYQLATEELPEIGTLIAQHAKDLDAIVDASPALTALSETGTPKNIAIAMVEAGRMLAERKKSAAATAAAATAQAAADEKKKEMQRVVKSNARPASADVLAPHGANPSSPLPLKQKLSETYDRIAGTLNH